MIVSSIKNHKEIVKLLPQLEVVFDFIKKNISAKTPDGKIFINKNIYAVVQTCSPKPKKEQVLEKHKKYIDLQYVISGEDRIGWKYYDKNFKTLKRYSSKNDITFYSDKPDIFVSLKKGDFAIFFSEDTHAPLCGKSTVKKCIVKISSSVC